MAKLVQAPLTPDRLIKKVVINGSNYRDYLLDSIKMLVPDKDRANSIKNIVKPLIDVIIYAWNEKARYILEYANMTEDDAEVLNLEQYKNPNKLIDIILNQLLNRPNCFPYSSNDPELKFYNLTRIDSTDPYLDPRVYPILEEIFNGIRGKSDFPSPNNILSIYQKINNTYLKYAKLNNKNNSNNSLTRAFPNTIF